MPLLVARYAATGQLGPAVAAAVRVQQDSETAVAAALALAAVLERVVVASDSVQVPNRRSLRLSMFGSLGLSLDRRSSGRRCGAHPWKLLTYHTPRCGCSALQ